MRTRQYRREEIRVEMFGANVLPVLFEEGYMKALPETPEEELIRREANTELESEDIYAY